MEKSDVIIRELIEWLGFHKTQDFIERNPRFLPHEVRDILVKVFECGERSMEEELKENDNKRV